MNNSKLIVGRHVTLSGGPGLFLSV